MSASAAHDGRNFSKQRWFQQGSSNTYVDPISLSALAHTPTMTVATPLFDRTGQRVAVLAANLNLERLDQIVLPAQGLGSTGQSYLVGSDGRFVSTTLRTGAFAGRISSPGIAAALGQHDGRGLYRSYAGVPVIGVYDWMPELNAALVAEQSQHAAFAPARRLAFTLAGIGVVVAALLGLAIYIASRRLARPILAITETATAVAAGDLTREAPVTTRDEVGQLAIAFNAMTAQLRETLAGLEQRVAERTEELRLQNVELAALHETTLGVMHRLDLDDLLRELLSRACELLGVHDGYFYVRDPDEETLVSRVAIGVFADAVGTRIPRGGGVAGRVWEDDAPVIIEDYDAWEGRVTTFPAGRIRALVGVPISSREEVIGVLGVARDRTQDRSFNPDEVRAAATVRATRVDRPRQCTLVHRGAGSARTRGCCEHGEEHLPRSHEPRDPDADERCDRHERPAAQQRAG